MLITLLFPLLFANMTALGEVHIEEKTVHQNEYGNIACSCVDFVRQYRSDIPSMNADRFVPATTTPREGAVALMHYPHSGAWHLAIVLDFGEGWVRLRDANYEPCKVTERVVQLPDRIVGYL